MKKLWLLFAICSLLFVSACAQTMETRLDTVRGEFAAGNYDNQKIGDRNLDPLLRGNALFQAGNFAESDAALEDINKRLAGAQSASFFGEVAKALSSQMAGRYKPYFMDGLFISYYQLWDAIALGRMDDARVIINQSYARQQEMSREFASLISDRRNGEPVRGQDGLISQLNEENSHWRVFGDIMNPALMYLAGIYFLNDGDYETARTYLARADGMTPGNEFVRADLNAANARKAPVDVAWIFIESGFAPKLTEWRIDLPVPTGNGPRIVSVAAAKPIALPAPPAIDGARMLADVDAMFMTEFSEYQVNAALRSLASAVSKLALQSVANDQLGPLAGFVAAIYSAISTGAEVRSWVTLPKRIYILRVRKDNSGLIKLFSDGRFIGKIEVGPSGNDLIYIRFLGGDIRPKVMKI
ncbi:MAG: hypothetical protein FWC61_01780 [Proteobacteria bacterium]|nr:hypothetical protein [Pseudomonadota bacterium]